MYSRNIKEQTIIAIKQIGSLVKSKISIVFFLSFFLLFYLTSKDIYLTSAMARMPVSSANCWHGLFTSLTNTLVVPLHYWIFFMAFLFLRVNDLDKKESLIRFLFKRDWFWGKVFIIFIFSILYSIIYICIIIIANIILYGYPNDLTWGQYYLSNFSVIQMLAIALPSKFFPSATIGFVYLYAYIKCKKLNKSILFVFLYITISVSLFEFTPKYHSIKPLIFPASTILAFFLEGNQLENFYSAFIITTIISSTAIYFSKKELDKLEIY